MADSVVPSRNAPRKEWCSSRFVEEFSYKWKIKKFDRLAESKYVIESPTFTSSNESLSWMLHLYPKTSADVDINSRSTSPAGDNNSEEDSGKDMIFYLFLQDNNSPSPNEVQAKFHISVFHDGFSYRPSGYDEYLKFVVGQGWRVVWRKELFDMEGHVASDGSLTILCDVSVKHEVEHPDELTKGSGKLAIAAKEKSAETLQKLLDEELFADVVLSVKGREFPAHRSILSAQSSVFRQMFEQSKDSLHNRVLIADMTVEVLEAMLRYIYTGKVPENMSEIAEGLLAAGEKYQLEELKVVCGDILCRELSIESAAYLLVFAAVNSCKPLKYKAVEFIAAHAHAVMKSEGWHLLKQHPQLLAELCQVLVKRDRGRGKKSLQAIRKKPSKKSVNNTPSEVAA